MQDKDSFSRKADKVQTFPPYNLFLVQHLYHFRRYYPVECSNDILWLQLVFLFVLWIRWGFLSQSR